MRSSLLVGTRGILHDFMTGRCCWRSWHVTMCLMGIWYMDGLYSKYSFFFLLFRGSECGIGRAWMGEAKESY